MVHMPSTRPETGLWEQTAHNGWHRHCCCCPLHHCLLVPMLMLMSMLLMLLMLLKADQAGWAGAAVQHGECVPSPSCWGHAQQRAFRPSAHIAVLVTRAVRGQYMEGEGERPKPVSLDRRNNRNLAHGGGSYGHRSLAAEGTDSKGDVDAADSMGRRAGLVER